MGRTLAQPSIVHIGAVLACAGALLGQAPQALSAAPQKLSRIDPAWASARMDKGLRTGPMEPVWTALKLRFPADYKKLMDDMSGAVLRRKDTRPYSEKFVQEHTVGQIQFAMRAPTPQIVAYQKRKAELIEYLAQDDVRGCAAMSAGSMPTQYSRGAQAKLALTLAAFVEAASAGRTGPKVRPPFDKNDLRRLSASLVAQGVKADDVRVALMGPMPPSDAEKCRYGVLLNRGLAAAPADIVAKLAFANAAKATR